MAPASHNQKTLTLQDSHGRRSSVALKANAGGVQALTHDGSLSVVTAAGTLASSRALPADKFEQARKDLAAAAAADAAAARKQERPDRILKLWASAGDKLAVSYWGGTLRVVDAGGKVRSEQQLPQDVTALTWSGGKLIAGLADGRVVALTVKE